MKYVYLLRAGANHYKVGVATSVKKRVSSLQTANPVPIEVVATVLVEDAYSLEGELHVKLSSLRSESGKEWFQLTADEALEIAILMNRAPEVDATSRITLNNQFVEQRLRHKSLEKKLDMLIGMHKKPRFLKTVDSHKEDSLHQNEVKSLPVVEYKDDPDTEYIEKTRRILLVKGQVSISQLQRELSVSFARAARIIDRINKGTTGNELVNEKASEEKVDDEYLLQALDIFRQEGKGSASLLQRRLSIGYGRAARLMDKLEAEGYISELDGARPRTLIDRANDPPGPKSEDIELL